MSDAHTDYMTVAEQKEVRDYIRWINGGEEPDWQNMAQWLVRCGDNRKRIKELERHSELLRAEGSTANDLWHFVATNKDEEPYNEFVHKLIAMAAKLNSAIDGGALDGEK